MAIEPIEERMFVSPQGEHGVRIEPSNQVLFWDMFNWDLENWSYPTWKLAVELWVPNEQNNSLWDLGLWDQAVWSDVGWIDVTDYMQGLQVTRGSYPGERPQVGTITLSLTNKAPYPFSPWSTDPYLAPSYMGPGTLIRVSLHDPVQTLWQPMFAGIVEDWQEETFSSLSHVGRVTITAAETLMLLARIDEFEQSLVGDADTPEQRITRLLEAADWAYGFTSTSTSTEPLISTVMAGNRITECYLVADSIDGIFRTARNGYALLTDKDDTYIDYANDSYGKFVLSHNTGNAQSFVFPIIEDTFDGVDLDEDTWEDVSSGATVADGNLVLTDTEAAFDVAWADSFDWVTEGTFNSVVFEVAAMPATTGSGEWWVFQGSLWGAAGDVEPYIQIESFDGTTDLSVGTPAGTPSFYTHDPVAHRWLKIEYLKEFEYCSWLSSPDGETWTTLHIEQVTLENIGSGWAFNLDVEIGSEASAEIGSVIVELDNVVNFADLPGFDPGSETRPADTTRLNMVDNSSGELSDPVTAVGDFDTAWSTDFALTGNRSTKVTVDTTNAGTNAWARIACSVPGVVTHFFRVSVYVDAGSSMIGQTLHIGYSDDTTPPLSWADRNLVEGWQTFVVNMGANTAEYFYIGTEDSTDIPEGGIFYLDNWLVTANIFFDDWFPADGEPLYLNNSTYAITGAGSYQGLDLDVGDVIAFTTVPGETWSLEDEGTWTKIFDASDAETYHIPYEDASLVVSNNDEGVYNNVLLSSEGGTEYTYSDAPSIERYGRKDFKRVSLQYKAANEATATEYIADRQLLRSRHIYRPLSCRLNANHGKAVRDFMALLDVTLLVDVYTPNVLFANCVISGLVHNITPTLEGNVNWTTDVIFDTSVSYSWTVIT